MKRKREDDKKDLKEENVEKKRVKLDQGKTKFIEKAPEVKKKPQQKMPTRKAGKNVVMAKKEEKYYLMKGVLQEDLNGLMSDIGDENWVLHHYLGNYDKFIVVFLKNDHTDQLLSMSSGWESRCKVIDAAVLSNRSVFVAHVPMDVQQGEIENYMREISSKDNTCDLISCDLKVKPGCLSCGMNCRKVLAKYKSFRSALDAVLHNGATLHGTVIGVKPVCLFDNFVF